MNLKACLYVFITALFSSLLMVPLLRHWALSRGEVDTPDARKVHSAPIPRLGGIAICMAFLFSLLVYVDLTREIRGILAGTLVIFFTGLVDDLHGLSPRRKFLGEVGACLVAMTVGNLYITRLGDLFGFGSIDLPMGLAVPFTVFAVVGVINAMNLIDGLDGLAGGVSVIALCAFFALAAHDGNGGAALLTAALLGGVLGFLKYNFYPARIFMGDTGSLAVGFVFGFLAVLLTQAPGSDISPIVPVLILGVPIMDTVWVMCRRVVQGMSPFAPDKTHVHHKFLDLGFQHRFTVLIIYGISLFWACVSVAFHLFPGYVLLVTFLSLSVLMYVVLRFIRRSRFGFLAFDSSLGIRESRVFQQMIKWMDALLPLVTALAVLFLLVILFKGTPSEGGFWQISLVIFLAGIGLLFATRDPKNDFLLAMLFLASLVIAFVGEMNGKRTVLEGMSLDRLGEMILLPMAVLVSLRLLFRRAGEFFLNTADFLVLAISIVLAVVLPQIDREGIFTAALPKGVILFLAVKTVSVRGRRQAGFMVGTILAVLAVISLRSFVGY